MYETFEHKADIGIRGIGSSLEKAFEESAKAMFSIECNIKKIRKVKKIKVYCEAENIEELFIEWLNSLLSQSSLYEMVFSEFKVKIKKNKKFFLEGLALGEKLSRKHQPKLEVKAATYSQLKIYYDKERGFIAQCIVDV